MPIAKVPEGRKSPGQKARTPPRSLMSPPPNCSGIEKSMRRHLNRAGRKTNTYAKATTGLQRLLRVYWVVHNFLRVHFTIREVPAVALGILERRLSVQEVFQIPMV